VELKDKDIPILGGAIAGRATHLLTGDERDFGALFGTTIRSVIIVSPRMLAEELARQGLF
jgi:predicted nucleic acid-binding protein